MSFAKKTRLFTEEKAFFSRWLGGGAIRRIDTVQAHRQLDRAPGSRPGSIVDDSQHHGARRVAVIPGTSTCKTEHAAWTVDAPKRSFTEKFDRGKD